MELKHYNREGFEVTVRPVSQSRVDPVLAIRCNMEKTKHLRPVECPLFLTLNVPPYRAISASIVGKILETAIEMAGLKGKGCSAKSFRPTGVTMAIQNKIDPDVVRKVGRWKSRKTFENHYVLVKPILSFTDRVYDIYL